GQGDARGVARPGPGEEREAGSGTGTGFSRPPKGRGSAAISLCRPPEIGHRSLRSSESGLRTPVWDYGLSPGVGLSRISPQGRFLSVFAEVGNVGLHFHCLVEGPLYVSTRCPAPGIVQTALR
ncbi:unnamed protein product, partial [Gulo gulo]